MGVARMQMEELRRWIIAAVVSDDEMLDSLVLKGGNALLLHNVTDRGSLDFDFSTSVTITKEVLERRLVPALERRLGERHLTVFGVDVTAKPKEPRHPGWGGFLVEFRLIHTETYRKLESFEAASRQALTIDGTGQGKRIFRIEISLGEFTEDKIEAK